VGWSEGCIFSLPKDPTLLKVTLGQEKAALILIQLQVL
jgi:hypothetical protein